MDRVRDRARHRTLLIVALVAAVGLVYDALDAPTVSSGARQVGGSAATGPASDSGAEGPAAQPAPPVTPARRVGPRNAQPPTQVVLPSGLQMSLAAVSSRPDGVLDVPDDIGQAGWWRGGAELGDPFGSSLVAAHVDSVTQGLGPFAELLSVRPGARVVLRSASLEQVFRVRSLQLIPRGTLGQHRWIYGTRGERRLTLVTCAGPYDRARGGYQNLAVVVATPQAAPASRARR